MCVSGGEAYGGNCYIFVKAAGQERCRLRRSGDVCFEAGEGGKIREILETHIISTIPFTFLTQLFFLLRLGEICIAS